MTATSLGYQVDQYSLAQSFYVNQENGIFVTKIQLFFQQQVGVTNILPVLLELRPMVNGFPSSSTLIPGSEVVVKAANINVSANASTATDFTFDEPIFLKGLTDYCFVVATNTKDYKLFASQGDSFVIGSSSQERISKQQTNGSLFFSQNAATFTPAQDTDLAFKIKQAAFKSHLTGTITLKNTTMPQKLLDPDPITTTNGSPIVTIKHLNHGFQPRDYVNIKTNLSGGNVGGLDSATLSGQHRVLDSSIDHTGFIINVGTNATSSATGGGTTVLADKNMRYSILHPNVATLVPNQTGYSAGIKLTSSRNFIDVSPNNAATTRYTKDTTFSTIGLNVDNQSDTPLAILNSHTEDSAGITGGSAVLQLSIGSADSNVSPMIDLQRASITTIGFQIDKQAQTSTTGFNVPINYVDESSATGGSSASKHITSPILLAEPAVGLKIILSANRPSTSDFQLWFRTATSDQILADQPFVLQAEESNTASDDNPSVFADYEFLPGGIGGDLIAFTQFQLKIVMRSTDFAKVPTIRSLRVIALST